MVVEKNRPPAYWPSDTGGVVFDDLVISYAPNLPPVLRNISFEVGPREKVGIVSPGSLGDDVMVLMTADGRSGEREVGRVRWLCRFSDSTSRLLVVSCTSFIFARLIYGTHSLLQD